MIKGCRLRLSKYLLSRKREEAFATMLQAIVNWSIRNRIVVVVLAGLLLVVGFYAAGHSRMDVFPEFAPPQVVIQTEAPGLSPQQVEQLVTLPIEQQVNGLPHLEVLRSQSIQGLSVVTIIFQDGTDIYRARQHVAERLAELAGQLPAEVKAPRLAPLTGTTGRLLTIGFTSQTLTPMELRDLAQWTVRPRLLGVPGVAQVTLFGGQVRQFQVQVRPDALHAHGLALSDVLEAARQATGIRGAGFLENDNQRIILRVEGQIRSAAELGATVLIAADGSRVLLNQVAAVTDAPEPLYGAAAIDGRPGVVLIVNKQLDSDTLAVTRRVEKELERLIPTLQPLAETMVRARQKGVGRFGKNGDRAPQIKGPVPVLPQREPAVRAEITYHPALFRQANFIDTALGNVTESLLIGAALVAAVLFLFLFNVRTALISLTAIPLSLFTAIIILWAWGIGINTLTLGGLAIAVGEVVDDAIIDVENIFRRLALNAQQERPRAAAAVVLSASLEVRSAVVYATFVVVLVFVPVFFLTGLQGRLFAPLGYAYVLAVLASLGVALTVTPALAMLLLPRGAGLAEPPLLRRLQNGYERLLRRLDGELPLVLTLMGLFAGAAVWAIVSFGGEFLPELRENHFVVHMRGLPGTSLPQALGVGRKVNDRLHAHPAVRSVNQQAGRAELGEDTWGVEYSEFEVDLKQGLEAEQTEEVEQAIRNQLARRFTGYNFEVLSFLSERIKETLSGARAAVVIKVYGQDLTRIEQAAEQIARALRDIPGRVNPHTEAQMGIPELVIRIRPRDAAPYGLRNAHLLEAVQTAYQGAEVGQVYEGNRIVKIAVILDPRERTHAEQVADLELKTPRGIRVRLRDVADVFLSDGRFLIRHEGLMRHQQVTCNVGKGTDLESFVAEAQRQVKELRLPAGTYYQFSGEHEAKQATQHTLFLLGLVVLVGIVLLLGTVFRSARLVLLILVNLPFALVGGVAAVYLSGGVLDAGSLVGFVTLFGITMRNGIMLISHWQHLREVEGMPWGPELIFRGARERLAPVLMTALVTGLGLLPIALGSGEAGREIEGPMALVILGGLMTSTALNLLVLPMLYRRLGPFANIIVPESAAQA
jgi:Cu/Ag efflux pump CusA